MCPKGRRQRERESNNPYTTSATHTNRPHTHIDAGMRRSSYFTSEDDPFSHIRVKNAVSEINGLNASKHVRIQTAFPVSANLGVVNVEWKSTEHNNIDLPFDPPVLAGLHVLTSLDADAEEVNKFLKSFGIFTAYNPIEAAEWSTFFDYEFKKETSFSAPKSPIFSHEELQGALAFRISTNPESQHTVMEAWFGPQTWNTIESKPTEVGIFKSEKYPDAYVLTGRTRMLGKDSKSSPTMFRWYPKHFDFESQANASLNLPYGLHPVLELSLDAPPPSPSCGLFALLELPQSLFIDRYELEDLEVMTPPSNLDFIWGEVDLEMPEWSVNRSSTALIQLFESSNATYKVPMHFRYQSPSDTKRYVGEIGSPYIFWACQEDSDRNIDYLEPREFIGIESLFPLDETKFYVWHSNPIRYEIPAIDESSEYLAEWITVLVVVLGAISILIAIVRKLWITPQKLKQE